MELRWSLHLDRPADAVRLLSRKIHTKDLIYSADAEIGAQSVNFMQKVRCMSSGARCCVCCFPSGPVGRKA